MINFFQNILGKIVMGISSIFLMFSGTTTHPQVAVQDIRNATTTQPTQQVATSTIKTGSADNTEAQELNIKKPTCTVSVSPSTIIQGNTAVLSWKTTGVEPNSIAISSQEVSSRRLAGGLQGVFKMIDSRVVAPSVSMEYSINTYVGNGEGLSCKATLTVLPDSKTLPVNTVPTYNNISSETIFCNGINWSKCPMGQNFVCPAIGNAYCQDPPSQLTSPQTQTQKSTTNQAKESELKALDEQFKALQTELDTLKGQKDTLPCHSFITGEMAAKCKQLSLDMQGIVVKQQTIVSKQALLLGIYSPAPFVTTPTFGSIECYWSNGGTVWNCSAGTPGGSQTRTECSWSNGGTQWSCH